jgi:hypothetical protein
MFNSNSITTRIAVGKMIGTVVGVTAFFFIPYFLPEANETLKWGVLFWYITFGAVIGVFGVYTTVPVFNIPTPWWIRGAYIGAWLNFTISLIAYDELSQMMVAVFGGEGVMTSPFWMILEGAIVGFVVDYFATKFGGEGAAIVS